MQIGSINQLTPHWLNGSRSPEVGAEAVHKAVLRLNAPFFLLDVDGQMGVAYDGAMSFDADLPAKKKAFPVLAYVPATHPKNLGDALFKKRHGLTYAYIIGAMANGITSVEMVRAVGEAGMLGMFGAAGLSVAQVEDSVLKLRDLLEDRPFGSNLIHSPGDPEHEMAVVRLYLKHRVRLVSASAYLSLTLPLVYYRVKGIFRDQDGNVICPNKVIGKVSRIEVARRFMSPPPEKLLIQLVDKKMITREEASLAAYVPMADDITAEADSGGHTDNQPAIALLPTMLALRDEMMLKYNYPTPICVGLAGGIATPASAAAAFAMGAGYVLTGSVNQSCVEAGTSEKVRCMLAESCQADVTMAPAADMFEMGIKVQVLKRGTMFAFRAAKLYELYSKYDCIEDIPRKQRDMLERDYFKCGIGQVWEQTRIFFQKCDPAQILLAEKDPKHKMALLFRSYLGQSSNWASSGEPDRIIDYQIWCGPSMGAFNEWVRGSFLEKPENRKTVTIAMNLMFGASLATRVNWLRCQGAAIPSGMEHFSPLTVDEISALLTEY
ncbi:MAG: PfaD family polyunsaturated fatty acid/polyketide biosynthesis protein [Desulfobacterales bacterium]